MGLPILGKSLGHPQAQTTARYAPLAADPVKATAAAIAGKFEDAMKMGGLHAAIFGSVARGDDRNDSDVDVMVDVDQAKIRGIFAMGRLQTSMEEWIGRPVDLARRDRLRPNVADEAERGAVHAGQQVNDGN